MGEGRQETSTVGNPGARVLLKFNTRIILYLKRTLVSAWPVTFKECLTKEVAKLGETVISENLGVSCV